MSEKRIQEIKALIKKSGLSIAQVARKADISNETLYRFLRGQAGITLAVYDKILDALAESIINPKGKK